MYRLCIVRYYRKGVDTRGAQFEGALYGCSSLLYSYCHAADASHARTKSRLLQAYTRSHLLLGNTTCMHAGGSLQPPRDRTDLQRTSTPRTNTANTKAIASTRTRFSNVCVRTHVRADSGIVRRSKDKWKGCARSDPPKLGAAFMYHFSKTPYIDFEILKQSTYRQLTSIRRQRYKLRTDLQRPCSSGIFPQRSGSFRLGWTPLPKRG